LLPAKMNVLLFSDFEGHLLPSELAAQLSQTLESSCIVHRITSADAPAVVSKALHELSGDSASAVSVILHVGRMDNQNPNVALAFYVAALKAAQYCAGLQQRCSLCFVTEGAGGEACTQPLAAFFQGFSRAVGCEIPHTFTSWVDLDPTNSPQQNTSSLLAHLMGINGRESEVSTTIIEARCYVLACFTSCADFLGHPSEQVVACAASPPAERRYRSLRRHP